MTDSELTAAADRLTDAILDAIEADLGRDGVTVQVTP